MNKHEEFDQILLGSLLGDGNLQKRINKNGDYRVIYRENHSIKQKQYALFKVDKLKNLNISVNEIEFLDKRCNKKRKQIIFWSKKSSLLKNLYSSIYFKGKKIINKEILNKLNPLAIAIWYCDDGNYSYRGDFIVLSTESYSLIENILIQSYFKKRFDIDFIIVPRKNNNYRIRLNIDSTKRFIEIIKPHIPKCMNYKIGVDKKKLKESKRKLKKYMKGYYIRNNKKLKKDAIDYYHQNEDKIKKNKKKERKNNIDFFHKKESKYRKKNRKRIRKYNRNYYKKNKEKWGVKVKDNLKRLLK